MKPRTGQTSTVLSVDDDEAFLRVLGRALLRHGLGVITATTAAAAVDAAVTRRPDSAVVDLKLGAESGLNVIGRLKDAVPDIAIVVLTGYASITTAVAAVKLGAVDYLAKPVKAEEVMRALADEERLPEPAAE